MEAWILIAFFGYKTGGFSAEFTTKERCEAAATQLMQGLRISSDQRALCVQK